MSKLVRRGKLMTNFIPLDYLTFHIVFYICDMQKIGLFGFDHCMQYWIQGIVETELIHIVFQDFSFNCFWFRLCKNTSQAWSFLNCVQSRSSKWSQNKWIQNQFFNLFLKLSFEKLKILSFHKKQRKLTDLKIFWSRILLKWLIV